MSGEKPRETGSSRFPQRADTKEILGRVWSAAGPDAPLSRRELIIGSLASAGALKLGVMGADIAAAGENALGLTDTFSTNTDGVPVRLFIDSETSELTVGWHGLSPGETLGLFVEISGEGGQVADITASSGDDLSFSEPGNAVNLRPGEGTQEGIRFDAETEDGQQLITLEDMCGSRIQDFENGKEGLDLDEEHPTISADAVMVDPDSSFNTADDFYTEYDVGVSVSFVRMETRETLETLHDSFSFVHFLETSFGAYPGLLFGRSHPDIENIGREIGEDELPERLRAGLFE